MNAPQITPNPQHHHASAITLLFLLLAADAAFIGIHLLQPIIPALASPLFSLETDRGYAEVFQYIQEFWVVGLLLLTFRTTKNAGYVVWAMLFGFMFFDDAAQIHERLGIRVAQVLPLPNTFGLRPQDFGELIVSAALGLGFLSGIALCYRKSPGAFRTSSQNLLTLLLAIVFFGVVMDALHVALHTPDNPLFLLGMIEDGGEMIAIARQCCEGGQGVERDIHAEGAGAVAPAPDAFAEF